MQAALKAACDSESSDQQQMLEKIRVLNARIEQLQAHMTIALRLAVCEEIKFNASRRLLDEAVAASKCEVEELKAREQEALAAVESWKSACWQRIARLEREMMAISYVTGYATDHLYRTVDPSATSTRLCRPYDQVLSGA
ncbi:hypothetical protein ATCC90586_010440 [Pythium insidiosum]|nr:hypothetical protein ATCC90586_010440 [Pythium insidiosum]